MLLYQSTLNNYSIGDRVVPSTPTTFYPEATAEIGRHRPPDLPSSSICLLATDDLAFCYFFALRQQWDPATLRSTKLRWTRTIGRQLYRPSAPKADRGRQRRWEVTSEYWTAIEPWTFREFFGPTMTVSREVEAPVINQAVMLNKYRTESDRALSP